jgi:hypothetical protein
MRGLSENTDGVLRYVIGMRLPRLEFARVKDLFAQYRGHALLNGDQALLAQEAGQRIADVELLSNRIVAACEALITPEAPQAEEVVVLLKDAAAKDPALARWLAQNPTPRLRQASKGFVGGAESGNPFASVAEQELRLQTESFYYTAHRLMTCIQRLPGLNAFKCRPISIVRNQLLEHPEGAASGVILPSFAYNTVNGPVIKGIRTTGQEAHSDAGFIPNCQDFIRALEAVLDRAIKCLPPGAPPT